MTLLFRPSCDKVKLIILIFLQFEWNARTQITMWYDTAKFNQSKLHDYGNDFFSDYLRVSNHFKHTEYSSMKDA